jgi:hypothetical protein
MSLSFFTVHSTFQTFPARASSFTSSFCCMRKLVEARLHAKIIAAVKPAAAPRGPTPAPLMSHTPPLHSCSPPAGLTCVSNSTDVGQTRPGLSVIQAALYFPSGWHWSHESCMKEKPKIKKPTRGAGKREKRAADKTLSVASTQGEEDVGKKSRDCLILVCNGIRCNNGIGPRGEHMLNALMAPDCVREASGTGGRCFC